MWLGRFTTGAAILVIIGSLEAEESRLASLGKKIFLDTSLSNPVGQGCVSCHQPQAGFADPRRVSPGAVEGLEGRRNAPTLMYAALVPPMKLEDTYDEEGEVEYIVEGGLFLDGRAQNLFEQVKEPFFDPNEMNLKDEAALATKLRKSAYAGEMKSLVGEEKWQDDLKLNEEAYRALVEFLREPMFRPFDAPIDDYWAGDRSALTLSQRRGLDVFETTGACASCHWTSVAEWPEPLLTDSGYDNIGAPGIGDKDPGLGGVTGKKEELGQFKVPTLRNVALTGPYLHNGSMKTLREVIEFYNKRDVEKDRWGKPHFPATVNKDDMGDLKLSEQQVDDLVNLMEAFTDRSLSKMKKGQLFPEVPAGVPSTEERRAFFTDPPERVDVTLPRRPGRDGK